MCAEKYKGFTMSKFKYALPSFDDKDAFLIKNLLPAYVCTEEVADVLSQEILESAQHLVMAYRSHPEFSAGTTKRTLRRMGADLEKMRRLIKSDENVKDYLLLKAPKIVDEDKDISESQLGDFLAFFSSIDKMCQILEYCNDNYSQSGGRHKNTVLSRSAARNDFVRNLKFIYEKALDKKASYKYEPSQKQTRCEMFIESVLERINEQFPGLNNGYSITFSISDVLRQLEKSSKKMTT